MAYRNLALVLAAAVLAAVSYFGFDGSPAPSEPVTIAAPAGAPLDSRPDLERLIRVFEDRTATSVDPLDFRYLGRLYLTKGSLSDDLPAYRQAQASFAKARVFYPDDIEATSLQAQAAFFLHDFAEARRLVGQWERLMPNDVDALALAGDIDLASGDVAAARAAFDKLAVVAPAHPAVQARLAQLAVAEGDPVAGLNLATTAQAAAIAQGFSGQSLAWYQSFHGQLAFDVGEYARSERSFADALENVPGSAHDQAGVARARAAQGDLAGAIGMLELATADDGAIDDLGYLGDLYQVAGRPQEAAATFQRIEDQLEAGTLDLTVHRRLAALYFLDHDIHVDLSLELAETDLGARHDAGAWDTYAWALFKNGRLDEAQEASDRALRSGVAEAAIHFHAGVISAARGNDEAAVASFRRALEISPSFHPLHAPLAAARLEAGLE